MKKQINERELIGKAIKERMRFEEFLSTVSSRFVNIHPDQVDSEIQESLKQILDFFMVDRCGLIRVLPGKGSWQITHVALSKDTQPVPVGVELPTSTHPWVYHKLIERREVVSVTRPEDLPPEANIDKQTWMGWGIRSTLTIPIFTGGSVVHAITLNSTKSETIWSEELFPRLRLLGDIFVNAMERKRIRLEIEERFQFERLISDLTARFVNLAPDQVEGEIKRGLRSITEFFDADRSTIALFSENRLVRAFDYHLPEAEPAPESMSREQFPWYIEQLKQQKPVVMNRVEDLPPEAEEERQLCLLKGIKSILAIPVARGGKTLGTCSLVATRTERVWPEQLVQRFRLVIEVFFNALERKQAEQALRESEEHLSLATASAETGIWVMNLNTHSFWATDKLRELYRLALDEELNFERFMEVVHPDDRERVRSLVRQSIEKRERLVVEYRILCSDGSIQWILSRGRPYYSASGQPERLMGASNDITERKQMENQLKGQLREIKELKQRLENENIYLQEEVRLLVEHAEIVGQSVAMNKVLSQAEQVAKTDSTVMIQGETGTGKELLARAIHNMSSRRDRPLVTVNCASLPPTLIESELFGRERGAYTGALTKMTGRFEIADKSTLFLDEVGELPLELQSKLLRVLEEGSFERLGSTKTLRVDVRIIAATNRDIEQEVKEGRFRKDLFYRLNVFPIVIPPLRERLEDIPLLVWSFVREFEKKMGKRIHSIPKKNMEALQSYSWPGNVRELRNVIERGIIVSSGGILHVPVGSVAVADAPVDRNLEEIERRHILSVLEKASWRLTGKGGAAETLGLKRTTLQSKMKKLGIKRRTH